MVGNVNYFSCCGKNRDRCKDVFYFRENGEYGIYALADGINSKKKSHIGAEMIQRMVADLFEDFADMFFEESLSEIKSTMIEIIRDVLYNLSEDKKVQEEYASTMMMVFISRKHNCYRWLHIGDGIIVKESPEGEIEMISRPHNGITNRFTYTTCSEPLDRYLHMDGGSLDEISKIILLTDGAVDTFYREGELTINGKEFLAKGADRYYRILKLLDIQDDHSMLEIVLDKGGNYGYD